MKNKRDEIREKINLAAIVFIFSESLMAFLAGYIILKGKIIYSVIPMIIMIVVFVCYIFERIKLNKLLR